MSILELASIRAKREVAKQEAIKRRKKYRWRLLESKVLRAFRDSYSCCNCIVPIMMGDEYERRFFVNNAGWHKVERQHYPRCYAPTEEEDQEITESIERDREREAAESATKKKAA